MSNTPPNSRGESGGRYAGIGAATKHFRNGAVFPASPPNSPGETVVEATYRAGLAPWRFNEAEVLRLGRLPMPDPKSGEFTRFNEAEVPAPRTRSCYKLLAG